MTETLAWFTRLYGDAPGVIGLSHPKEGRFPSEFAVTPKLAAERAVALDASGPRGVYHRTTTIPQALPNGQRGGADDAWALPGLWADVDFGTVGHKHDPTKPGALPLPPDEDAARQLVVVSGLPAPSLWVHSGGGFYPWWLLDTPFLMDDNTRPLMKMLSEQWQQILKRSAANLGWEYGAGVGSLDRVLRVPGTTNRKAGQERPCYVAQDDGVVYTVAELLAAVQAAPQPKPAPAPPAPRKPLLGGVFDEGQSPLDALDEHVTFDDILVGDGWSRHDGRHGSNVDACWSRPGGPDNPCSAHTLREAAHVLVVFSELAGLPTGGGQKLTKGRVFAHLHHNGDEKAAARDIAAAIAGRPCTPAAAALPLPRRTMSAPALTRADLVQLEHDQVALDHEKARVEESQPPRPPLQVVRASEVPVTRVTYLWEYRIPLGAMTLMPGEEGIGKTTVGIRIIADITRGTLPGEHHGRPRDVVVMAAEDGLSDVFVPRLRQAGADLDRVHIVKARVALDGSETEVIVPRDLDVVGGLITQTDAALLWIDSLATALPDELKSIAYKDTAKVLRSISQWAEQHRISVVAPWHLNKASGGDTAVRIMDSRAFRTAVRAMLLVVTDPDAPEGITQGIVALDKANAGTLAVPALRYRIRSAQYVVAEVDQDTGEVLDRVASCGVADWVGEVEGDGRQIAREALTPRIEQSGNALNWLRDYLRQEGEVSRSQVMADAASEDGHSESAIKRAARTLGVVSREQTGQDANGRPYRRAMWSLPSRVTQSVHTHPDGPTDPTGEGSSDPTDLIYAGQPQSGQSGQSGMGGLTGPSADPTGAEDLDELLGKQCPDCRYRIGHASACPARSAS